MLERSGDPQGRRSFFVECDLQGRRAGVVCGARFGGQAGRSGQWNCAFRSKSPCHSSRSSPDRGSAGPCCVFRRDLPALAVRGPGGPVPRTCCRPAVLRRRSSPRGLRPGRTGPLGPSRQQGCPQHRAGHRNRRPALRRRHPAPFAGRLAFQGQGLPGASCLHPHAGCRRHRRRCLDAVSGCRPRAELLRHRRAGDLRGPRIHPVPRLLHDRHRDRPRMAGRRRHCRSSHHGALRRPRPWEAWPRPWCSPSSDSYPPR